MEEFGFTFNSYDPCVATQMWKGNQQTIRFYVDDLMASHVDKRANDDLYKWLQKMYSGYGDVIRHRGKVHDYLSMDIDFREEGKVKFDMMKYVANMLKDFPMEFKADDMARTPASNDLFGQKPKKSAPLKKDQAEVFHTMVAKGLFLCK